MNAQKPTLGKLLVRGLVWIGEGFIGAAIILVGCAVAVLLAGSLAYVVGEAVEGIIR